MPKPSNTTKSTSLYHLLDSSFLQVALIIVLGVIIYSNTFQAPFQLDTITYITKNQALLKNPNVLLDAAEAIKSTTIPDTFKTGILTRRLSLLTFALNYRLHGLEVYGYHLVNILIHIINALILYYFFILLARTRFFWGQHRDSTHQESTTQYFQRAAFVVSLLFVTHPVQTQAVTYIVQRFASLATFFFLLTLTLYLASVFSRKAPARNSFYLAALLAAFMAMFSKEISYTLPAVIILIELIFLKGSILHKARRFCPFLLTMCIIPYNILKANSLMNIDGKDYTEAMSTLAGNPTLSNLDYLFTQFRVIVTYLRLLFLPIDQNLLYDYPIFPSFLSPQVLLSFFLLLAIGAGGVWIWYRSTRISDLNAQLYRLTSFGIFWFFITMSVESSIIPIESVIYEHRLYLPSIGFFVAIVSMFLIAKSVFFFRPMAEKFLMLLSVIIIIALSTGTYMRNSVWQSGKSLWEDTVAKSPGNSKAWNELGIVYEKEKQPQSAIDCFRRALELDKKNVQAYVNLGRIYHLKGEMQKAIDMYLEAKSFDPKSFVVRLNLGLAYVEIEEYNYALNEYQAAMKLNPYSSPLYNSLAAVYYKLGQYRSALAALEKSLEIDPSNLNTLSDIKILKSYID